MVIDAGSSHSRVTLYQWQGDKFNQTGLVHEVTYCETDRGITKVNTSAIDAYFSKCLDDIVAVIDAAVSAPICHVLSRSDSKIHRNLILKLDETISNIASGFVLQFVAHRFPLHVSRAVVL